MQKDNVEGSGKNVIGHHSLSDSPYVGGNKMSSSLKDRLKRFRKYSSPISRPSTSTKKIDFEMSAHEYSKEEIEKAMNEPEPGIKEDFQEGPDSDECDEMCDEVAVSDANASCKVKKDIDNYIDEAGVKETEDICSYSKEDIENCVEKETMVKIFHGLQKEYTENQEKLRKLKLLKLVQQHHTKNSPEALNSLNQKWLTCTQLALRKLYSFMPGPRNMTFETFLMFLDVDFNTVKYNPETDSFS